MATVSHRGPGHSPDDLGEDIMRRLAELARCSEPGPGVTRMPFTNEHACAIELLRESMQAAGLDVRMDDTGTLIGRREGTRTSRTLLMGSHQDSIPHGGRYDGILGIVLPVVCLERIKDQALPYSVEVLAFADEEGVRFPTALIGPRALAGTVDPGVLDAKDRNQVTVREAMLGYGLQPDNIETLHRDPVDVIGFLESHIEQGPVLEDEGLPVGLVTSICGIERWSVSIRGRAAHAGTTPMHLRRDALAGAAEVVSEVERYCRDSGDLVGVVGSLTTVPNAVNVIPAEVSFSVELRSGIDAVREKAGRRIAAFIERTAKTRNLEACLQRNYAQPSVQCDAGLSSVLDKAFTVNGLRSFRLTSGATHDASAMADLSPIAMLFIRCLNGISHHHEESITTYDAGVAAQIVISFLQELTKVEALWSD